MITTYFLNCVSGNIFHSKTTPGIPSKYYVGLSSTDPAAFVTEPSGGAYARVEITGLSEPTNGVVSNSAMISFPESTAAWGTMTHFVVYDALTGGNLLMYGKLPSSRTVEVETITSFKPNALTLTVASAAN